MSTASRPVISPTQITATGGIGPHTSSVTVTLRDGVALGSVKGAKVLTVTGRRTAVSTEAEAWAGTNVRPTRSDTPGAITVVSTAANDAAAGSRAQVVALEYIDANGYERIALASLNGLTPVTPVQAISQGVGNASTLTPYLVNGATVAAVGIRVNRAYVIRTASPSLTNSNEGSIRILIGAQSQLVIGPTHNISWSSWVTVPRGMVGIMHGFAYEADRNEAGRVTPYVRRVGFPVFRMTTFEGANGVFAAPLADPIRIAGLGEFGITFTKDAAGLDLDVAAMIQVNLHQDPDDPDPNPDLQAPPFG